MCTKRCSTLHRRMPKETAMRKLTLHTSNSRSDPSCYPVTSFPTLSSGQSRCRDEQRGGPEKVSRNRTGFDRIRILSRTDVFTRRRYLKSSPVLLFHLINAPSFTGVPKDMARATAYLKTAANSNHLEAHVLLGQMYINGWGPYRITLG